MSWKGWLTFVIALWLIVSVLIPGISGSKGANLANFLIVGIVFLAAGLMSVKEFKLPSWLVVIFGVWLIVSAFVPGITSTRGGAIANGLIFGVLNLILSFFMKKKEEKKEKAS